MPLFAPCPIRLTLESTGASWPSSGELTDAANNLKVRSSVGVQRVFLEARHSSPYHLWEEHRQARGLVALPSDHDDGDSRSCNKAERLCSSRLNPESIRANGPYKWKGSLEYSTLTLRTLLLGPRVKIAGGYRPLSKHKQIPVQASHVESGIRRGRIAWHRSFFCPHT